jgi:hypothetical protein
MIRQAISKDIPAITELIRDEEGMWQDAWADDAVDRAIMSSNGLAYVWDDGFALFDSSSLSCSGDS